MSSFFVNHPYLGRLIALGWLLVSPVVVPVLILHEHWSLFSGDYVRDTKATIKYILKGPDESN